MRNGFLVLGMELSGVQDSSWRNNLNSSARFSRSDSGLLLELLSSLEYLDSEVVFWGSDSWSNVRGDESMLGVQRFAQ